MKQKLLGDQSLFLGKDAEQLKWFLLPSEAQAHLLALVNARKRSESAAVQQPPTTPKLRPHPAPFEPRVYPTTTRTAEDVDGGHVYEGGGGGGGGGREGREGREGGGRGGEGVGVEVRGRGGGDEGAYVKENKEEKGDKKDGR